VESEKKLVATFSVIFDNGGVDAAAAAQTDIDALGPPTLRFKLADDATIDENDKMVVPAAGTAYTYWKHICLLCDAADGHTINNVAIYSDGGSFNANVDVMIGDEHPERTSASDAGYEVANNANELVGEHGGITGSSSLFGYTAGEGTDFDITISEAGNIINAANETCNYAVLQMNVASTADPGDLANETGTFSYDEA